METTGIKVPDAEVRAVNLTRRDFHATSHVRTPSPESGDPRRRHILVKLTEQGRTSRRFPLPCVPSKLASMV
jgi:hypothetical protein